jgi:hypothetical protein
VFGSSVEKRVLPNICSYCPMEKGIQDFGIGDPGSEGGDESGDNLGITGLVPEALHSLKFSSIQMTPSQVPYRSDYTSLLLPPDSSGIITSRYDHRSLE